MDEELRALRERIATTKTSDSGRRHYTIALRNELIEYARRRVAAGASMTAAAKELGLSGAMMIEWLKRSGVETLRSKRKRLRQVEVEASRGEPRRGLVLLLGHGARIEGLEIDDVIALMRSLL